MSRNISGVSAKYVALSAMIGVSAISILLAVFLNHTALLLCGILTSLFSLRTLRTFRRGMLRKQHNARTTNTASSCIFSAPHSRNRDPNDSVGRFRGWKGPHIAPAVVADGNSPARQTEGRCSSANTLVIHNNHKSNHYYESIR
jgi:hypothetical protein